MRTSETCNPIACLSPNRETRALRAYDPSPTPRSDQKLSFVLFRQKTRVCAGLFRSKMLPLRESLGGLAIGRATVASLDQIRVEYASGCSTRSSTQMSTHRNTLINASRQQTQWVQHVRPLTGNVDRVTNIVVIAAL